MHNVIKPFCSKIYSQSTFNSSTNFILSPAHTLTHTTAVSRKNEFPLYSIYPVNPAGSIAIPNPLSGARLSRKPSFGKNRPFLHQYEVKGQQGMTTPTQHNSAPNTPVKSKEAGFKRSLSFGGGVNPKQSRVAGSGVRGVAPSISGLSVRSGGSEPVGKHCECAHLVIVLIQ